MQSKWSVGMALFVLAGTIPIYGLACGPSAAEEVIEAVPGDRVSPAGNDGDSATIDLYGSPGADVDRVNDNELNPDSSTAMMSINDGDAVPPDTSLSLGGDWNMTASGPHLYFTYGGLTVARLSATWDRFLVFRDLNGVPPYFYFNAAGDFGVYP